MARSAGDQAETFLRELGPILFVKLENHPGKEAGEKERDGRDKNGKGE